MSNYRLYLLLIYATIAAMLISCSKENTEPDVPGYEPSSAAIGFGVPDDWMPMTKATAGLIPSSIGQDPSKTSFYDGDAIGVFGYYLGESGTVARTNPNFMYNQIVTRGAGENAVWDYSPKKYWSNNPQDKFAFFAYYPHSTIYNPVLEPDITWSANNTTGTPTLTYTAPENSSGSKVDFLYAKVENTRENFSDDKVSFNFKHMLGKVQFKFDVAESKTAYVKSIRFSIPKTGTFNYTENNDHAIWMFPSELVTKEIFFEIAGQGTQVPVKEGEDLLPVHNFTVFALPCTSLGKLTLRMSTDHYTYTTITTDNNVGVNVVAGKVTTVTVTITPKGLSVTADTQDWKEETYSPTFTPDKD